jgi:hypothetical protein
MGDWYSLEFLHLKTGTLLEYCVVEYAHNGLTIKNSQILVSNCEVRYNYHAGIRTEVKSTAEIKNSIISENGYAGLICELGAKPVLTDNLISLNRIGVVIFSLSEPNLGSLAPGDNYNPGRNNIFNNEEYNLYNHSNKKIRAENNSWGDRNRIAIAEKIYDQNDNSKYGAVDFTPVFRQSGQQNLGGMLLLAQNSATPPATNASAVRTEENPAANLESLPAAVDTTTKPAASQNLAANDAQDRTDAALDLSKKLEEMAPIMASAAKTEPPARQLAVNSKEVKNKIDYNQTFLELFLDGGKKKYRSRPSIDPSRIPKNIYQQGEIRIKVVVDKVGNVESATVLRGINDILDRIVVENVEKFKYKSGRINGQPVKFTTSEVFRFQ